MKVIRKTIILFIALFSVFFLFSEKESIDSMSIIEVKAMNYEDFPTNI